MKEENNSGDRPLEQFNKLDFCFRTAVRCSPDHDLSWPPFPSILMLE